MGQDGSKQNTLEENEQIVDTVTKSIIKKNQTSAEKIVHQYEIILAINCHDLIDYITSWEWYRTALDPGKITSQFLRDRCYTFHKDTYIAVDSLNRSDLNFSDLFAKATQQNYKKIAIKSTDCVSSIQKLCNSNQLNLASEKARAIHVNVLLRLPNTRFFTFAIDLVRSFGRINTLVLDCRAINHSKLLELLDQFKKIPGEIIHDLEFIINFNPNDQPTIFSSIVDSVHKITNTISFEITTYGDETQFPLLSKGLDDLAEYFYKMPKLPLNSFCLKFYGFFNQDADIKLNQSLNNLIINALKSPKNEVLRALTLDYSQLYLEQVDNLIKIMKTLSDKSHVSKNKTFHLGNFYLNLQNQIIEDKKLVELLNSIGEIQKIAAYNFERMTFHNFCLKLESSSENILTWFSELIKTENLSKQMFTHVNIDLKHANLFKHMRQIIKKIVEISINPSLFSTFILPTCNISQIVEFEESMKIFFKLVKTFHRKVFEVVYFNFDEITQLQFDQINAIFTDGFKYLEQKLQQKDHRFKEKYLALSSFFLSFQQVNSNQLSLKEFKSFCEQVYLVSKRLSKDHKLFQSFYIDFSQNIFRTSSVTDLNKSLEFLGRVSGFLVNYFQNFGIIMKNCQIKSEQFSTIFEGLKYLILPAQTKSTNFTLQNLFIDLGSNQNAENLDSLCSFLEALAYANIINKNSFTWFALNFQCTPIDGNAFEQLPQYFKSIVNSAKAKTRILEQLVLNFNYCNLNLENQNNLLDSLINLHPLIDQEKLHASTLNTVELHLNGIKFKNYEKLLQLLENFMNSGYNNFQTFNSLILSLNDTCTDYSELRKLVSVVEDIITNKNKLPLDNLQISIFSNKNEVLEESCYRLCFEMSRRYQLSV